MGLVLTLRLKIRLTPTYFSPLCKGTGPGPRYWEYLYLPGGPNYSGLATFFLTPASFALFHLLLILPNDVCKHLKEGLNQVVMLYYLICIPCSLPCLLTAKFCGNITGDSLNWVWSLYISDRSIGWKLGKNALPLTCPNPL